MNKIDLTAILSLLLVIMPLGCSVPARVANNESEIAALSDRLQQLDVNAQNNNTQHETEIQSVNRDLDDLKVAFGREIEQLTTNAQRSHDELKSSVSAVAKDVNDLRTTVYSDMQTLSADIENRGTHFENGIAAMMEDVNDLRSDLNDQVRNLDDNLQRRDIQHKNDILAVVSDVNALKSSVDIEIKRVCALIPRQDNQLENAISAMAMDVNDLTSGLEDQAQELSTDIQQAKTQLEDSIKASAPTVPNGFNERRSHPIVVTFAVAVVIISLFLFLRHKMHRLVHKLRSEFGSNMARLEDESAQLDMKLMQMLQQQLDIGDRVPSQDAEPDHSFPRKVCEEIQRMRNRIKHMDPNEQATKVFGKRLDSLEATLGEMGYDIIDLEKKPYSEAMTVKAMFVPKEDMKEGEAVITRVIKPQIHYKNVLIQAAEVEVSQGVSF